MMGLVPMEEEIGPLVPLLSHEKIQEEARKEVLSPDQINQNLYL